MDYGERIAGKLDMLFPDEAVREGVRAELARYGIEPHEEERARVCLAVLKLAGADAGKVRALVDEAKVDYRDVLASAEYPNQMREDSWKLGEAEKAELIRLDEAQYEEWIRGG